jgi:hypothetical protein
MAETSPLTLTVPEAGKRYFALSRNAAYAAAARGEIPTIKIGRLLRVPVRACEQMLDRAVDSSRAGPPRDHHQPQRPVPGKENAGPH